MVNYLKVLFILLSFFLIYGCGLLYRSPCIETTANSSGKLKLKGYYYYENFVHYKDNSLNDYCTITFLCLYENGVILGFSGKRFNDYNNPQNIRLKSMDEYIRDNFIESNNDSFKNIKSCWAGYKIEGDSIIINKIGGRFGKALNTYKGLILNDSTFTLLNFNTSHNSFPSGNKNEMTNEEYHFRMLTIKPDSVNTIINLKQFDK